MKLGEAIDHLEELLHQDDFPCEECRKEHLELLEWLEELRESRKVIRLIQEQLLNSSVNVLSSGKMAIEFD